MGGQFKRTFPTYTVLKTKCSKYSLPDGYRIKRKNYNSWNAMCVVERFLKLAPREQLYVEVYGEMNIILTQFLVLLLGRKPRNLLLQFSRGTPVS